MTVPAQLQRGPARDEATKRLARVLRMLRIIESEPSAWTRERLALHLGMSSRQIDKDLALLRAVGYDIRHHRSGYEIVSHSVT